MLILQRKTGQSLCLGDDIEITVVSVESGRVRLAIDAPKSLPILRSELKTAIHANRDAAQEQSQPIELIGFLDEIGLGSSPKAPGNNMEE